MNFNQFNLDARLLAGVQRLGYITPTAIQTEAIPLALEGKDLIGTAQTGTGKTAAFGLHVHRLGDPSGNVRPAARTAAVVRARPMPATQAPQPNAS